MINAPSGGAPEKAPRWDLSGTEGCGGGIRFSWCSWMFGGVRGYIYEEEVRRWSNRGPTTVEDALMGGRRAPASWLPPLFLDAHSKSPGSCLLRKSRSRSFHSVWTSFDIPFLRNTEIGKKTIWAGPPVNRLVPKIIYKSILKPIKHPKQII